MRIPVAYRHGYREALAVDLDAAYTYVAHTLVGDPVMDAVIEDLAPFPQSEVHRFIQAGMEEDHDGLKDAPGSLQEFFLDPTPDPDWLDHDAFTPGIRAFQRDSYRILSGFVTGVLTDGFATLISKSFVQTGRIFDNGVRRLQQNNRHFMEIFFPGGLRRYGDGWKLSVRIRFIHAQVRRLLGQSPEWNHEAWGVPISASHVGYAAACFSGRTIKHSQTLGARYSAEERASFHAVWRYAGYLMGIPEPILLRDEEHARQIYRIGSICEPPPTQDAIIMTNALVNSAPLVAGVEDPQERKRLVNKIIYPLSRALIGKRLADRLKFPPNRKPFTVFLYKLDQFVKRIGAWLRGKPSTDFATLIMISVYDEAGFTYRLPDHVHDEESSKW